MIWKYEFDWDVEVMALEKNGTSRMITSVEEIVELTELEENMTATAEESACKLVAAFTTCENALQATFILPNTKTRTKCTS